MNRLLLLGFFAASLHMGLTSCAKHDERKVVGPSTETSKIPWNRPIAGQGGGQMGMMPQNMHRR